MISGTLSIKINGKMKTEFENDRITETVLLVAKSYGLKTIKGKKRTKRNIYGCN